MRSPGSWNSEAWRRRPVAMALLLLIDAGACAHDPPAPTRSVAILPVDTLGVPPAEGEQLKAAVARQVERSHAAQIAPPERSDLALTLTLAGLGDVRLVRSQLVQSGDRLLLQDLKDTVPAGAPAMDDYAVNLARRLFPEPARRPWYRQWWLWTIAAAAAGAAATATWALSRGSPDSGGVMHIGDL